MLRGFHVVLVSIIVVVGTDNFPGTNYPDDISPHNRNWFEELAKVTKDGTDNLVVGSFSDFTSVLVSIFYSKYITFI